MKFSVLGPLEIFDADGRVRLGSTKQRLLLAALLVQANTVVSVDRLADILWGEDQPADAAATLQNYVSRLRAVLEPGEAAAGRGSVLLTRAPGYLLHVEQDQVDASRFESLVADGLRHTAGGEPERAASTLDEALALWRGRAFAEFADEDFARTESLRLEELKRLAVDEHAEANLSLGRHTELVGGLEGIVAADPLRERPRAQLMLALYRCGREAAALRSYQDYRAYLADELGIEPSKELVSLEEAILLQKPDLDRQTTKVTTPTAVETLPSGVVTFLLSDIVASTSLWEQHPKAMADAVARHDTLMRGAVTTHGGTVLKARGEGDSTFSVFTRATDAVAAGLSAQRALLKEAWPESAQLSVRMALHTGEAFERGGDFFGPTVNRAARIRSLAAGGQVLLSHSTGEFVRDDLPEHAALVDLGSHVLKDLARAEPILGLAAPGLPEFATLGTETLESPAGAPLPVPSVLREAAGDLFVGRGPELETLMRAWKDTSVGERRAVLISGEPGVGKTRLAAELASIVASEDTNVLYGRCDEDLGIPYQPWVEALRHVIAHEPREFLAEHVARHGRELARLVPELTQRLGHPSVKQSSDPDAERYLLFGAAVGLIARVSSDNPVLLVLEDLHWADKPSLLLLRHLIASTDPRLLLVVGTYRPTDLGAEHPLTDVLAALHREEHVRRVDLRGLDDAEVVALLEAAAGHALDDTGVALAHALHRETDGNPFFAGEILRHLAETGAISQRSDGRWGAEVDFRAHGSLPTSVREVVGRRVARLGEETEQTLRAAAVIGRDFELDLLAQVTDQSEEHLLDLLAPAIRVVVIKEVQQHPGRHSFSHALIEHTLYDDLGPTRRQRLHLRVAAALETLYGDDPGDRLGELAYHWTQASQPADTPKAIEYALRAGDHALAKLAPDDAVAWYDQALEFIDRQPGPDEPARCQALVGLGIAQRGAGDPRYRDTLLGAADRAQRLDSPGMLVRAALATNQLGRTSVLVPVDQERVDALEAALTATDGTESPQRAMVLATLAAELTRVDPDRARALSDEALVMARRVDDDLTLWGVLERRPFAIWSPATLEERTANAHELREVAERLGDQTLQFGTANTLVNAAACRGDLVEVDEYLDMMIRVAGETGLAPWRDLAATSRSWRQLLAGHIGEAERAAGEALQIARRAREPNAVPYYDTQIRSIRRAQGRLDALLELIEQAVSENPGLPAYRAALVSRLCSVDRLDDARVHFEPLAANGFTDFPFDLVWLTSMTWCAEAAASLEHRSAARLLAELLAPWHDQLDFTGISCNGSVARPLGLVLATAGRFDEADDAFAQAAAVNERIDAPIELARTQVDWARMLTSPGRPGDPDRARRLLDRALTTANKLGSSAIQRHAQTLLATLTTQ